MYLPKNEILTMQGVIYNVRNISYYENCSKTFPKGVFNLIFDVFMLFISDCIQF